MRVCCGSRAYITASPIFPFSLRRRVRGRRCSCGLTLLRANAARLVTSARQTPAGPAILAALHLRQPDVMRAIHKVWTFLALLGASESVRHLHARGRHLYFLRHAAKLTPRLPLSFLLSRCCTPHRVAASVSCSQSCSMLLCCWSLSVFRFRCVQQG